MVEEVRRLIRASVGNRAKESLVVEFINQANLDELPDKASVIEAFFSYARAEQQREAGEASELGKLGWVCFARKRVFFQGFQSDPLD